MDTVDGYKILDVLKDITKAGDTFHLSFFKYSRSKNIASAAITHYTGCRCRVQMPHDKISIDGANLFLFEADGTPKMCYKNLIRYVGLPYDNYKPKKVIWYHE